jgi:DNA ligase (NAD+)
MKSFAKFLFESKKMTIQVGSRSFQSAKELETLVIHAATEYETNGYAEDLDGVEITDPEYDVLFKELKKLLPKSAAFKGTSPSIAKAKGSFVKHDPPMTSINKADGTLAEKEEILNRWIADCKKRIGLTGNVTFCQTYKHDGVALRVNYVDGKLVSAGLRPRDGVNGSDVTRHMKYIKGVPQTLPLPLTLSLNGEIECWDEDFALVNADQDAQGEDQYKNPRNFTAGCMGRDDAEENKHSRLRIAFYSITGFLGWSKFYTTEIERAKWANSSEGLDLQENGKGFFVQVRPFEYKHLATMEDFAKKLPYYTDGVVIKVNDLEQQEELGHTGDDAVNAPRGALAWKFMEETAEAVVSSIQWKASRTGRIVPTAIFDTPFVLADTENSRATCNNYGWMEAKGLGPGAKVRTKKGGKIIPNIMEVLSPVSDIGAPANCPACGEKSSIVVSSSGSKDLTCKNQDCGAKHVKSWLFYIAKLGGKGIGLSVMEKILQTGKVKTIADLYDLSLKDLLDGGFTDRQAVLALATIFILPGDKNKDNADLLKDIEKARGEKYSIEAWKFFASLGIHGAGETAGKTLIAHYKSFDKIRKVTAIELEAIDGIGSITAAAIVSYFKKNKDLVDRLLQRMDLQLPKTGVLTGKNFCLTGSFASGKKHWQQKIEDQGGNIQSSVGKTTNFLIQEFGKNDGSPSEKETKANKLGVPVISVADLEKML